jgi:uncharacterized protein YyaL (SSP411 family)
MRPLGEPVTRYPQAFGHLLQAMAFQLGPVREVALVGEDVSAFLDVVRSTYRPLLVLAGGGGDVPLLEGRVQPGAYVCEGFVCHAPVRSSDELRVQLDG